MNIEALLESGNFYNEYHRLRVNLLYSSGWLRNRILIFLEPYDITQQQFNILRILRGQFPEALSTQQIRERMIDKMSDTSRLVDRLIKKGFVTKKPSKSDKRLVEICITAHGMEILSNIDQDIHQLDRLTEGLTPEEASELNRLLNKMRNHTKN